MPTWPASVNHFEVGVQETYQEGTLRSPTDIGPAKVRARFTAVSRFFTGTVMLFSVAERSAFDTFYETTLNYGALTFDLEDPVDGSTTTDSFRFTAPPSFEHLVGGASGTLIQRVSLSLERLPV